MNHYNNLEKDLKKQRMDFLMLSCLITITVVISLILFLLGKIEAKFVLFTIVAGGIFMLFAMIAQILDTANIYKKYSEKQNKSAK